MQQTLNGQPTPFNEEMAQRSMAHKLRALHMYSDVVCIALLRILGAEKGIAKLREGKEWSKIEQKLKGNFCQYLSDERLRLCYGFDPRHLLVLVSDALIKKTEKMSKDNVEYLFYAASNDFRHKLLFAPVFRPREVKIYNSMTDNLRKWCQGCIEPTLTDMNKNKLQAYLVEIDKDIRDASHLMSVQEQGVCKVCLDNYNKSLENVKATSLPSVYCMEQKCVFKEGTRCHFTSLYSKMIRIDKLDYQPLYSDAEHLCCNQKKGLKHIARAIWLFTDIVVPFYQDLIMCIADPTKINDITKIAANLLNTEYSMFGSDEKLKLHLRLQGKTKEDKSQRRKPQTDHVEPCDPFFLNHMLLAVTEKYNLPEDLRSKIRNPTNIYSRMYDLRNDFVHKHIFHISEHIWKCSYNKMYTDTVTEFAQNVKEDIDSFQQWKISENKSNKSDTSKKPENKSNKADTSKKPENKSNKADTSKKPENKSNKADTSKDITEDIRWKCIDNRVSQIKIPDLHNWSSRYCPCECWTPRMCLKCFALMQFCVCFPKP